MNDRTSISEAVQIAASSDVSIIFAGCNHEYESEGFDLDTISLPERQIKLIKAVAAVSDKTVLVLNCGNTIDVSTIIDDIGAVLNAHFPGQEGGQALTNIFTGKTNLSGRLATTWPKKFDEKHISTLHNFPRVYFEVCRRYLDWLPTSGCHRNSSMGVWLWTVIYEL